MLTDVKESDLEDLLKNIMNRYGYDFSEYAKSSLIRRISRFMTNRQLDDLFDLNDLLLRDEGGFNDFLTEVTVNVTEMFRDPSFYKALRSKVIPKLHTYPHVKVWDAGCSSGEETYSLAILMKEEHLLHKTKIYATDINHKVLSNAKEGIYSLDYMSDYSRNYQKAGGIYSLSDYYLAKYNNAIMDSDLKRNLVFAAHNLVSDGSFNEFNLVVCRNVLIYFQKELQEKVFDLFLNSLCIYGFLVLGSKESLALSKHRSRFEIVDSKEKIYRKIG